VSIRRDPRSPFWQYNFQINNRRFFGSTKKTTRREAEAVERQERERAKALIAQAEHARISLRLDDVAGRYWIEHAQHLAGALQTEGLLGILIEFFGKDKLITEITDDDVARMVAWRRGHRAKKKERSAPSFISPFTVNHTTATLRKLFTRAKLWGVRFAHEPKWSKHMLAVPDERVRELSDDEADKLDAAMRADYAPFFALARASGLRLAECLLRWSEVKAEQIVKLGKGARRVVVSITFEIRTIIESQRGHHPVFVFTYVPQRKEGHDNVKTLPERRPLTYAGVQKEWKQLRKRSGVVGFRFHDYRHDFGTKLLRISGNLKLVQKAMNHRSIKTTMRYAHVLDSEVAEAMERVAKLRKKPRTRLKVV
jgi:integrase